MKWLTILALIFTVSAEGPREVSFDEWSSQPIEVAQKMPSPYSQGSSLESHRDEVQRILDKLKNKKRVFKKREICDVEMNSVLDIEIHCPCLSSCSSRAGSEESGKIISEAVHYCLWASKKYSDWWVPDSWEVKEVMKRHCPNTPCLETNFQKNPSHTLKILTDDWSNAEADTVSLCFPNMREFSPND